MLIKKKNVVMKEAEKILKYKDLTIEIQLMRNVKAEVKPLIIAVTGTISKSLRQYLSNIPGMHEIPRNCKKQNNNNNVPQSVETSHEGKVTKCEPTELFLTTNRPS